MTLEIDVDHWRGKLASCKEQSNILQFGVNHKLLKSEEDHQKAVLQELKEIELSIKTKDDRVSRTVAQIFELKSDIEVNVLSLDYLANISNLEKLYSELTGNVGACAVHQSLSQNFSQEMFSNKPLTSNVKECWSYVTKLAQLAQVHLRNASHYHQFHHDLNETTALLNKRWSIVSNQVSNFESKGTIKEADQLTNNLKDHLSHFLHLWDRGNNLLNESRKIVPVNLRQDPISQNHILGHSLIQYKSKEITIGDREEILVLNNSNSQFWKVKNNRGEIGEVPSVCLWIPGPDNLSTEKAVNLRKAIVTNWEHCLNRFSIVLIDHYINLFERILSEPTPAVAKLDQFRSLLNDVEEILITNSNDTKARELRRLLQQMKENIVVRSSSDLRNNRFYKESEVIKMHTPLIQYMDHLKHIRLMLEALQSKPDIQRMREDQESREHRMSANIQAVDRLNQKNRDELNRLVHSMESITIEQYNNQSEFYSNNNSRYTGPNLRHSHEFHLSSDHVDGLHETSYDREPYRDHYHSSVTMQHVESQFADGTKSHHKKRAQKVDSQTQLGVTVRDSKIQCTPLMYDAATFIQEDIMSMTDSSITSIPAKERTKSTKSVKQLYDVQTQIGVIIRDSSTQDDTERIRTLPSKSSSKHKNRKTLIDSITQIGCFTESTGTQVNRDKKTPSSISKAVNFDAMTQIGVMVTDTTMQTVEKSPKLSQRDCQTQIGRLYNESMTQTNVNKKSRVIQTYNEKWDVMTQIAVLTKNDHTQADLQNMVHLPETRSIDCLFNGGEIINLPARVSVKSEEVQTVSNFDYIYGMKKHNKIIQSGATRLEGDLDTSCQIDLIMVDIQSQTPDDKREGRLSSEYMGLSASEVKSSMKGKKVQVGYSKIFQSYDVSCQTGHLINDCDTQTDLMYDEIKKMDAQMTLAIDEEDGLRLVQEKHNKKIQVGDVRMTMDLESACQTGCVVKEFEMQTEEENESHIIIEVMKEFADLETQPSMRQEPITRRGKKVQVGYPRIHSSLDSSIQTGMIVCDMESQTEGGEEIIIFETRRTDMKNNQEEMSDKEVQFHANYNNLKVTKGKKLQVGEPRLIDDSDVTCQTGHVVKETSCQTEEEFNEIIRLIDFMQESTPITFDKKEFASIEVQSNITEEAVNRRGKKVQVGYSRMCDSSDSACQIGICLIDVKLQTEIEEEVVIYETRKEEMQNERKEMIDEEVQFDAKVKHSNVTKGKKLQIGEPRLMNDSDVSCQTGHVVKENACQTEEAFNDMIRVIQFKHENAAVRLDPREFANAEIQSDVIEEVINRRGKKVQVGYPRITDSIDSSIQAGLIVSDMESQTEVGEEVLIYETRKEEMQNEREEMFDEEVQFDAKVKHSKVTKGKKLQIGEPRLMNDSDVSCQTGHVVKENACQTEEAFNDMIRVIQFKHENAAVRLDPREFANAEIQSDVIEEVINRRGKKVQVGYPRITDSIDSSIQAGLIVSDMESQTEVGEEVLIYETRQEEMQNEREEMFDEEVQFDAMVKHSKVTKGKKLQIGEPRLMNDSDVSCQTGHVVKENACQTVGTFREIRQAINSNEEMAIMEFEMKEFNNIEIQSVMIDEIIARRGKKVQVGYPQLYSLFDSSCQAGVVMSDTESQTDDGEEIVTFEIRKNELSSESEEMFDDEVQFEERRKTAVETKGKKLQVGDSRLMENYEVSCQTGHVIRENGSQTDEETKEVINIINIWREETSPEVEMKEFMDIEIQSAVKEEGTVTRGKKIQVGYPRVESSLDSACQIGTMLLDVDSQTVNAEEIIVFERGKEELQSMENEMLDKYIQYSVTKEPLIEMKAKKLQVGDPRLNKDFEVSCQTGHVIRESACQTEEIFIDHPKEEISNLFLTKIMPREIKEFSNVEQQVDFKEIVTTKKGKKLQAGYPRLNQSMDVACQSGIIFDDAIVQTEIDEDFVNVSRMVNENAPLMLDGLIDAEVQYQDDNLIGIILQTESKAKKVQVGNSRLYSDYDVSSQSGHIVRESECQTESYHLEEEIIDVQLNRHEERELMMANREFEEKEIQSEIISTLKKGAGKKIQVGYAHLNESIEAACQTGIIAKDNGMQTEIEETIIKVNKTRRQEAALILDDLIDEEVQFNNDELKKEIKNKKLQVGRTSLFGVFEVSCQTGHIIKEMESQTEADDFDSEMIFVNVVQNEEQEASLIAKEFVEKEIQSEEIMISKVRADKKVQVGYPHLNETLEAACQSGVIVDDIGVQTEMEEAIMRNTRVWNEEAALELDEMIVREVQYNSIKPERKVSNKKMQVGRARLDVEFEVSCQTGHIVKESECQTESYDFEGERMDMDAVQFEESLPTFDDKEFAEKEIQSEEVPVSRTSAGKKVQVGYPHLNESLDAACQSGVIVVSAGMQTELEENMVTVSKIVNQEAVLQLEDLIDENLQYNGKRGVDVMSKMELKNKKMQVGQPGLEGQYEVACQTGHVVKETECQTEVYDFEDGRMDMETVELEETIPMLALTKFAEKEIQCEEIAVIKSNISKKVQVGYPHLNESLEAACQSGVIVDNIGVQTDMEEKIMKVSKITKEEASQQYDDFIDEEIQYSVDDENHISTERDIKNKKVQVGRSRLGDELEVSCQTGHIMKESECQTDSYDFEEQRMSLDTVQFEESWRMVVAKEFAEKEIQSEEISDIRTCVGKKVQVGYPHLNESLEASCQSGVIVDTIGVQTELDETVISVHRIVNENAELILDNLIDEEVQFKDERGTFVTAKKEIKNKKLQVGEPRLDVYYEVACQAGRVVTESESQTEFVNIYEERIDIDAVQFQKFQPIIVTKEFEDKEVQSQEILAIRTSVGKKIQVGFPHLNQSSEASCQTGLIVTNMGIQTETEEKIMKIQRSVNEETCLELDGLIYEEVQYESVEDETINKETKNKKMQVGQSKLFVDLEVSCQTGHIINESGCQTESKFFDEEETIVNLIETVERSFESMLKEFDEKEIQCEKTSVSRKSVGKKVQVGYPHLYESLEVSCQTGVVVDVAGVQTELDEIIVNAIRIVKEETSLQLDDLMDEYVQYCAEVDPHNEIKKDIKNKKLQVGIPRLDVDQEVSCQTGHILKESYCQTDSYDSEEERIHIDAVQFEESRPFVAAKEFAEKEIQSKEILIIMTSVGKKVQVGYPRINASSEVACQSGTIVEDAAMQTDNKEKLVTVSTTRKEEIALLLNEMFDEEIQFFSDGKVNITKKSQLKGKKIQVGKSRLETDFEVSCQTGHIITETECQTDDYDFDRDRIDAAFVTSEERSFVSHAKQFVEKEIQSEIKQSMKATKGKMVQVGYPRIHDSMEVACQSGVQVDDVEVQTEMNESMIMVHRTIKEESEAYIDEMINESVQYGRESLEFLISEKEVRGKKLQVGNSRLDTDFEVSCQTGHIITETECQTDDYDFDGDRIDAAFVTSEERSFVSHAKQFVEKEIQSEIKQSMKATKGKMVQVGYPRTHDSMEVACQSGLQVDDVEVQTEMNESMIIVHRTIKEESEAYIDEMINEGVQYGRESLESLISEKEVRGKKVQVGNSRLDTDFEVSCQTGHIIVETECQTDYYDFDGDRIDAAFVTSEERSFVSHAKQFVEKEIQSEIKQSMKETKGKMVQVGYPRIHDSMEVACQSGLQVDDVEVQTEMNESMIMVHRTIKEESEAYIDEMINEGVQYGRESLESLISEKEVRGKKLQVGNSRLDTDFEVSCQTGHIIVETECQTDYYDFDGDRIDAAFVTSEERSFVSHAKQFVEKEIQSEIKQSMKATKGKMVQVGYPRIHDSMEVACQSGLQVDDVEVQTEMNESMIMVHRTIKEESEAYIDEMINEGVQYGRESLESLISEKEVRGKKLQVGNSRLDTDFEVSCQTGHIIVETECQTDDYDFDGDRIDVAFVTFEERSFVSHAKQFVEKEIQSEIKQSMKETKGKMVQVGYPRIHDSMEVACQSGLQVDDVEVQTEMNESMIMVHRTIKEESEAYIDEMINESVQYGRESLESLISEKEVRGKKLQVGNSRLDTDFEVSCQTGHIITETECQTDDYDFDGDRIDAAFVTSEERSFVSHAKQFVEKEIQSEIKQSMKETKGKMVQVGYPRINDLMEVACQSGVQVDDVEVQTEMNESIIMVHRAIKEESEAYIDEMINESVPYGRESLESLISEKEVRGKKVQVGNSRLDTDFEVSCQTGHIIVETECQTDDYDFDGDRIDAAFVTSEERSFVSHAKQFVEKEIQSEIKQSMKATKGKMVQVGYPRIHDSMEVACQSGLQVDDVEVQTEMNESMIMVHRTIKEESEAYIDEMINEGVQYGRESLESLISEKEVRGKKLQVGNSRLDTDFEVSCQTGHIIVETECQTDDYDFDGDRIDAAFVTSEERSFVSHAKQFVEKEIQSEIKQSMKATKGKMVQVGYPRIHDSMEVACQSGLQVDDVEVQTEMNESMIMVHRTIKEESEAYIDEMINEGVQYGRESLESLISEKEVRGKKLQVGNSRLDTDFEVSCQTGHIIVETECQTDDYDFDGDRIDAAFVTSEERSFVSHAKQFVEKEIQSEIKQSMKETKGKMVQVGYPRIHDSMEVACQSGLQVDDVEVQTEMNESMIMVHRTIKEESEAYIDEMINESVQYGRESLESLISEKEVRGKKLQVGNSRLDTDFEVSCQTGHIVTETECQTDDYDFDGDRIDAAFVTSEERSFVSHAKQFVEKEIQSEIKQSMKETKGKMVQVGYPRINDLMEVACQSGVQVDDVEVQTEMNESIIMVHRAIKEESEAYIDEMINESVQYGRESLESLISEKEVRGKKLQVGNSRLDTDFEVSCQTGHIVTETECQTGDYDFDRDQIDVTFVKADEKLSALPSKEFVDKEIQSKEMLPAKETKGKKIQVGYPQMNEPTDKICQSESYVEHIGVQTSQSHPVIYDNRSLKATHHITQELRVEEVQYYDDVPAKVVSGKKIQVGDSKLDFYSEIGSQTEHVTIDSEIQTEDYYLHEEIIGQYLIENEQTETMYQQKEFAEKEIEPERVSASIMTLSNEMQAGYSQINESSDVGCQLNVFVDDVEVQTEVEETMIIVDRTVKEEALFTVEKMIDEQVQYGDDPIAKEMIAKTCQVGITKLDLDSEVSCQTGHVVRTSECQTENDYSSEERIDEYLVESEEKPMMLDAKEFSEKEIQSDVQLQTLSTKTKTVQAGFSQINECKEMGCQSKVYVDDAEMQTEVEETMIIVDRTVKEEALFTVEKMIDEQVQYGDDPIAKEMIAKTCQVGITKLDLDSEVSCQTGHVVRTSVCQTENAYSSEERIDKYLVESEKKPMMLDAREFSEKEIQSDVQLQTLSTKTKTVQAGFSQINECEEMGCQSKVYVDDAEMQTEVEETKIMYGRHVKEETELSIKWMVEEEVQFEKESIVNVSTRKEMKGKKFQVGDSKLDLDYEVSCQTGHVVMDSECQTEVNDSQEELIVKDELEGEEKPIWSNFKLFVEKEIESEIVNTVVSTSHKKLQVGYPQTNESSEVACQSRISVDDVEVQTDVRQIKMISNRVVKPTVPKMIDDDVQYKKGVIPSVFDKKEMKGKKFQVGDSKLDLDYEVSCQTGRIVMDSECQTEEEILEEYFIEYEEKEFIDKEIQPKYRIKAKNQKEVIITDVQFDSYQTTDYFTSMNVLSESSIIGDSGIDTYRSTRADRGHGSMVNQDSQYDISLMTTMSCTQTDIVDNKSLVNEMVQYSIDDIAVLSTKDCRDGSGFVITTSCRDENTQSGCPFSAAANEKESQCQFTLSQLSLDQEVQTSDYVESHSVSLQIAPKVLKSDQPAHLLLNYSNKDVNINTDVYGSRYQEVEYASVDIQKYSMIPLIDRKVQHMTEQTKFCNKLTTFDPSIEYLSFNGVFNSQVELRDKLVSYVPRRRTWDQVFEFDGISKSTVPDIDLIPKYITKDSIRLFESIATQVTDEDIFFKEMSGVSYNQDLSSRKYEKRETSQVSIEHDVVTFDVKQQKSDMGMDQLQSSTCVVSLTPKLIKTTKESVKSSVGMTIGEVRMHHYGSEIVEQRTSKVVHSIETTCAPRKMVDEKVMFEKIKPDIVEVSIQHDAFVCEANEQKSEMALEQSRFEIDEVIAGRMMNISTETNFEIEPTVISLATRSFNGRTNVTSEEEHVTYDHKTTSTPELVEKRTSATQVYVAKVYDGESQTAVSTANYGVQVTDYESMPSTPCLSPVPNSTHSQRTKHTLKSTVNKDALHSDACLDITFEEDYVFETMTSRSVVTTKQEILPKLSHDFTDTKEESANLLVTKTSLCSTKTQSNTERNQDAFNQTEENYVFDDDRLGVMYHRLLESRCVKEQGVQGSNVEGLFEVILNSKGAQYIITKYQQLSQFNNAGNQTENVLVNSVKTQFYPNNTVSTSVQTTNPRAVREGVVMVSSERETTNSIMSSVTSRPAHRNMRIQRGCSYFNMIDVSTNTVDGMGDHIEVTYTETILEESIITKRPRSKIETFGDDNQVYSRSSSLNRTSSSSTPILITNQNSKQTQTSVQPSCQIFVQQDKCDLFLTFNRIYQVTAVHDYESSRYVSLTEAIATNIINLEEDSFKISNFNTTTIENAIKQHYIR